MGGSESKPVHVEPIQKEEFQRQWAISTDLKWTEEEAKRLRKSILQKRTTNSGQPMKPKILIFGPTGMGKSSFGNGVLSAVNNKEHVSNYFPAGSGGGTFTKGFHGAKIGDMWLIDMGGIFESRSITDQNVKDIASGKIPFYAKLTENLEVKDREELMVPAAGKNDVSCVVIVLALGTEIPQEIKRILAVVMDLAGDGAISYRLVLTHVDAVDSTFKDPKRLPGVFDSRNVQAAVMSTSEQTGVPPVNISVVRNYANEPNTDLYSNILFLNAMSIIVSSAEDQANKRTVPDELMAELRGDDY